MQTGDLIPHSPDATRTAGRLRSTTSAAKNWLSTSTPKTARRGARPRHAASATATKRCWRRAMPSSASAPTRSARTKTSLLKTPCPFPSSPTRTRRGCRRSAYGARRRCTAGRTWGCSAPRSSSTRRDTSRTSSDRRKSRPRRTPTRCSLSRSKKAVCHHSQPAALLSAFGLGHVLQGAA